MFDSIQQLTSRCATPDWYCAVHVLRGGGVYSELESFKESAPYRVFADRCHGNYEYLEEDGSAALWAYPPHPDDVLGWVVEQSVARPSFLFDVVADNPAGHARVVLLGGKPLLDRFEFYADRPPAPPAPETPARKTRAPRQPSAKQQAKDRRLRHEAWRNRRLMDDLVSGRWLSRLRAPEGERPAADDGHGTV